MLKKIFKKRSPKVWAITSGSLVVLMAVVSTLCSTVFDPLLNFAFGGPKNIYAPGQETAYSASYDSKEAVTEHANDVNLQLCQEGMVLLKNKDNALPIATPNSPTPVSSRPKVSVFGKNSVDIAIGGSGSGAASGESVSIYDSLDAAGFDVNPTLKGFYENNSASGNGRTASDGDLDSGDTKILATGETPQSSYTQEVKNSYAEYKDAAIVVFTRIGGEGFDLPRTMKGSTGYNNEDDHFLQLDKNETELLKSVCDYGFGKVIVVLNSGSIMELSFLEDPDYYAYQEKIDAAIWMGYPGNSGATALGQIINGTVNPSGRTVDTFSSDFKQDPTWNNFGDNRITGNFDKGQVGGDQYVNNGKLTTYYFVDYEESVYVGYRYYETRGATDGEEWYDDAVVYPFGYGLSYTTFEWEVLNKEEVASAAMIPGQDITVEVKVTNTGDVAGKDVVELYCTLPYTEGEIAKPYEVLAGFEKTKLLEPGEDDTLEITFDPYYAASYDYSDANKNGFKGYELEQGEYQLHINKDAHTVVDTITKNLAEDVRIEKDPVTGTKVENLYTDNEDENFDSDTHLSTLLSRDNWNSTWPTTPTDADRAIDDDFVDAMEDKSENNPNDLDSEEYPMMYAPETLSLRDMLYDPETGEFTGSVSFDDPRWDTILDQMDFNQVINMYNTASYGIAAVDCIDLPRADCADGPVGWTSFVNNNFAGCASYCCGVTVASTWNKELATLFGESVGEEGLYGYQGSSVYTGWYAPAMNIHRSPFGGRNFEYYSEDPFLSGMIGAYEVIGANNKGVLPFIKHFALNEQETHRSVTGDCSWVTEQAMREIFLRPFEITVKVGKTRGLMTSFNRIGTRWTGGDYRLVTTILRDEWGFQGAVICDFNTPLPYMNARQMAYAGGDLNLCTMPKGHWSNADEGSTSDAIVARRILKDVAYALVNSNLMQGDVIGTTLPGWKVLMIVLDSVISAGIVISGVIIFVLVIRRIKKEEALNNSSNPDAVN